MFNVRMKCPFCGKELTNGERRKYETLIDHVDDPNKEDFPLRPTWVCDCEKAKDSFWDMFGYFYSHHFYDSNTQAIEF